jgi:hypothetical protein
MAKLTRMVKRQALKELYPKVIGIVDKTNKEEKQKRQKIPFD